MRALKLLSRLPFWVLYRFADLLYLVIYRIVGYRKAVVLQNLRNSFPDKSESELQNIAKGFYRNFTDVLIETLKSITISKEEILKRVHLINPELVIELSEQGKSTLVLASHQCNWEWCLQASDAILPVQVDAVYQHIKNPKFDQLMKETRGKFGARMVHMNHTVRHVIKHRHETVLQAIVADQSPGWRERKAWVNFLNQDTAFFQGIEKIAEMRDMTVFYVQMKRIKRGHYQLTFHPLGKPPYTPEYLACNPIIKNYAEAVEKAIQEAPSDWLWSHKRWKEKREQTEEQTS
jgi:KDO2-lipid IV(A) lauroyltransferase